jgi:hypothetical protein
MTRVTRIWRQLMKERFEKSDIPRWLEIKDHLEMTGQYMINLAAKLSEEGQEHLTEDDKNLVASAYSSHIAAVTDSLKINMMTRSRDRSVDDIEEIHKIIEILDCL